MTVPRIGISGRLAVVEGAERTGVNAAYVRAVTQAGAAPVILSPLVEGPQVAALLDGLDALVLSGGADVAPSHYGATPHPALGTIEPERDRFEFALLAEARARTLPVLAICRGLQLANVAFGGTLWQDLPSERAPHPQSVRRQDRVHDVRIAPGSRLAQVLGRTSHPVNSFHHQAIRDLAPGLRPTAHSHDGLVEGIETMDDWWFLGVQWHPEEFWQEAGAADQLLFVALAAACGVARA